MSEKKRFTTFEDLECWKACRVVRNDISILIKKLPDTEKYALADGMRRASRSITENIAEGFGRYHFQENIQFCRQSRGSLFEILDQVTTSRDEGYISDHDYHDYREKILHALAILNGYISYLIKSKNEYLKKNDNMLKDTEQEYLTIDPPGHYQNENDKITD